MNLIFKKTNKNLMKRFKSKNIKIDKIFRKKKLLKMIK